MRWKGRERSTNVEDRRGAPVGRVAGGGSLILIIIVVIAYFAGADIRPFLNAVNQGPGLGQPAPAPAGEGHDDDVREFIEVVLKDTENVWTELFRTSVEGGGAYRPPQLIIFSATTPTGCGRANAAMGPFYCPADRKVYIDPSFFDELRRRHNAPGDFAQAYVIAHEVAHHVQNSLGLMREVNRARRSGRRAGGQSRVRATRITSRLPGRRLGSSRSAPDADP